MKKVKPIFKVGDHVEPIREGLGFYNAVVDRIDNKYYYLRIPTGKVILPISSQEVYKLTDKTK